MQLFDTHVHFERMEKIGGIADVVARARAANVVRMVAVGGSPVLDHSAIAAVRAYPESMGLAIGYDRDQAPRQAPDDAAANHACARLRERVQQLGEELPVVALGEMGLDYHYSADSAPAQVRLFRCQLALARELQLPVIIHSREADQDMLAALSEHREQWGGGPDRMGVLHCFTGDAQMASTLAALGLFISFSGITTFRNADSLRAAAAVVPDDQLLIETDSPFLAPVPMRGKQNEPAYVLHVAALLAEVRGTTSEAIAGLTYRNGLRLFGMTG